MVVEFFEVVVDGCRSLLLLVTTAIKCYCSVHQHGRLVTRLKTI